jgi:F0F1-type ATP synthase membrane subunit a
MKSPLEQFDIINVKNIHTSFFDVSFNNIMLPFSIFIFFIILIIFFFFNKFSIIPLYIQNILEQIYIFIISVIKQQAGNYGLY